MAFGVKPKFTVKGKQLAAAAGAGQASLRFTHIQMGNGTITTQAVSALTALINPVVALPVTGVSVGSNYAKLQTDFSNAGLTEGFYWREVGVFAEDPDTGAEILYCYANCGELAEYISSAGEHTIRKIINVSAIIGDADNVTAEITDDTYYSPLDQLQEDITEEDLIPFFASLTGKKNILFKDFCEAIGVNIGLSDFSSHILNKNNPHNVTKKQIGLENAENTADSEKSVKYARDADTVDDKHASDFVNISLATVEDANDAPDGLSSINGNAVNNPFGFWTTLLTLGSNSSYYKQQYAFPWAAGEAKILPKYRVCDGGVWSDWHESNNKVRSYILSIGADILSYAENDSCPRECNTLVRAVNSASCPVNYGYIADNNDFHYLIYKLDNNYISIKAFDVRSNSEFINNKQNGVWSGWVRSNDGGNADTLDGKHLSEITLGAVNSNKPIVTSIVSDDGAISLSWTPIEGATAYSVAMYNNGSYITYSTSITQTNYTVTGLTNNQTYQFLVQAYVNGQWSPFTINDLVAAKPRANVNPPTYFTGEISTPTTKTIITGTTPKLAMFFTDSEYGSNVFLTTTGSLGQSNAIFTSTGITIESQPTGATIGVAYQYVIIC